MMRLKTTEGSDILVNPAHVVSVRPGFTPGRGSDGAFITMSTREEIHVRESIERVHEEMVNAR